MAIYVRVSTAMQADRFSIPMQKSDLIAYSELVLHSDSYEIFEDAGFSGKSTDRPAYQSMMEKVRQKLFTHVLVWKLDRISRNLLDFAEMYEELKRLGVTFISKNEAFDTSSAMGEAMLKIILVFAELERKITAERVTATMISRAASGQWNGGAIPYGYRREGDDFVIVESERAVIRLMRDMYLKTRSIMRTAGEINNRGYLTRAGAPWAGSTIHWILVSPFYTGATWYNRRNTGGESYFKPEEEWVIYEKHHPAIFTKEEYEEQKAVLLSGTKIPVRSTHVSAMRFLVYCGMCGARMYSTSGAVSAAGFLTTRFFCRNSRMRTMGCTNAGVTDTVFGDFVINLVGNVLYAKEHFSSIKTPVDLEAVLTRGKAFKRVDRIAGADSLFRYLARYVSDDSFLFKPDDPPEEEEGVSESDRIKDEIAKQEKALERLQSLFLYSSAGMTMDTYVKKKGEIESRIELLRAQLPPDKEKSRGNESLAYMASHLLLSARLTAGTEISYVGLAGLIEPEVFEDYLSRIISKIKVIGKNVVGVVFVNGIELTFSYK